MWINLIFKSFFNVILLLKDNTITAKNPLRTIISSWKHFFQIPHVKISLKTFFHKDPLLFACSNFFHFKQKTHFFQINIKFESMHQFFQISTVYSTFTYISNIISKRITNLLIYVWKHRKKFHLVIFITCFSDLFFFVVLNIVNFDMMILSSTSTPKLSKKIFIIIYISALYNCFI